jgi:hypothetical protein
MSAVSSTVVPPPGFTFNPKRLGLGSQKEPTMVESPSGGLVPYFYVDDTKATELMAEQAHRHSIQGCGPLASLSDAVAECGEENRSIRKKKKWSSSKKKKHRTRD